MATDGNPSVQMVLPLAEMVGWLRKGVGELVVEGNILLKDDHEVPDGAIGRTGLRMGNRCLCAHRQTYQERLRQ